MEYLKDLPELLDAPDYRAFLRLLFEYRKKRGQGFGYAWVSRKAGFSSRSFLRDVLLGEKRITSRSFDRICHAFSLRGELRSFFLLLVSMEEGDVDPDRTSSERLPVRIERTRERLRKSAQKRNDLCKSKFYRIEKWPQVFAALGSPKTGASLGEVSSRSGLSQGVCLKILTEMGEGGIARKGESEDRYFPGESHLVLSALKDEDFKASYLAGLKDVSSRASASLEREDSLFFDSVFSVSLRDMPRFKTELRELLVKFVDGAERPDGDRIAQLVVGFMPK